MLLDDIIELATDDKRSIGVLLRKCVVLAFQLKNEQLKAWANQELNGYPSIENLPKYRILPAAATGLFVGPGWARFQQGIPSFKLEKQHQECAEKVYIAQSVGTLEDTLKSGSDSDLSFPWNANLVAYYQDKLRSGWQLHSVQQIVPKSVFAGLLGTVRTRVLNMALELQSEVGKEDEDLEKIEPRTKAKVDQTINNYIYGGANVYVASGQSTMNATTIGEQIIVQGDWNQLATALKGAGINDPELKELQEAIAADGDEKLQESGKVMTWIKDKASKIAVSGVKVGVEVGKPL